MDQVVNGRCASEPLWYLPWPITSTPTQGGTSSVLVGQFHFGNHQSFVIAGKLIDFPRETSEGALCRIFLMTEPPLIPLGWVEVPKVRQSPLGSLYCARRSARRTLPSDC